MSQEFIRNPKEFEDLLNCTESREFYTNNEQMLIERRAELIKIMRIVSFSAIDNDNIRK